MEIKVLASGSAGNCYLVSDGVSSLLLEAGIPIRQIRAGCGFNLSGVSAALITHSHSDHCKAVKDLLKTGVQTYMPKHEIEAAKLQRNYSLRELPIGPNGNYKCLEIGNFQVQPFRVEHDTPEPVGYLLRSGTGEKLLYFTDTYYLHYRFAGLNYIIGECNYDRDTMWEAVNGGATNKARAKRLFTTHMSLNNFLDFLQATDTSDLRQIYICHMSSDHGNEEKIKDAVQRLTGAEVYIC